MDEAEFDKYVLAYEQQHRENIAVTGEDPAYFAAYKIRQFARDCPPDPGRAIDFGSGIGHSIPFFRIYLPEWRLTCADISQRSLDFARARHPGPQEDLKIGRSGIPAPEAAFDAAFSACVFHHIAHEEHGFWLSELRRVVRPGGRLTVFEHNPLNPLTRRAVATCPFDENARLLRAGRLGQAMAAAGWRPLAIRYHVFFPRFLAFLRPLEASLSVCPLGAQYSILAERAP